MELRKHVSFLPFKLQEEMLREGTMFELAPGEEILQEGQYIRAIPLVFSGLIKVFSRYEERELLLYYIRPAESCIMSFSAILENNPSKINAVAEEPTQGILLPRAHVQRWVKEYPPFANLFYQEFARRYDDLLKTIHLLLFEPLDKRLLDYLRQKIQLTGQETLSLRHWEIANDLGTVREVISRLLKKLEAEGKIRQHPQKGIEIL